MGVFTWIAGRSAARGAGGSEEVADTRVRSGGVDHRGAESRCHGRPADTGGDRHGPLPANGSAPPLVCHGSPVEHASTLLPVSNLTNLIAFSATGLTFLHFTAVMALPWVVAIVVELILSACSSGVTSSGPKPSRSRNVIRRRRSPHCRSSRPHSWGSRCPASSGSHPRGWPRRGRSCWASSPCATAGPARNGSLYSIDVWFCAFVLILGVVVAGVANGPIGEWIAAAAADRHVVHGAAHDRRRRRGRGEPGEQPARHAAPAGSARTARLRPDSCWRCCSV